MTPSQTIKEARKALGVGQGRFGEWIGVTSGSVRKWEHEKHPVPKAVLMFLNLYLHDERPDPPEPTKGARTWQEKIGL